MRASHGISALEAFELLEKLAAAGYEKEVEFLLNSQPDVCTRSGKLNVCAISRELKISPPTVKLMLEKWRAILAEDWGNQ